MKVLAVLFTGILCLSLTGCMETGAEKGAGLGAVTGGIIGGVIGHQSGSTAEGIAIGAIGGALLGGIIGDQAEKSGTAQEVGAIAVCPNGHQVDVTGFPPGSRVRCPVCGAEFNI